MKRPSGRQVATHAASAALGAVVVALVVLSSVPPSGPPTAPATCPAGPSKFSRTFDAGPYAGWRACIAILPGGNEFSVWNVTASWDERNGSEVILIYRLSVDVFYEAFVHENISYIESHEPESWNTGWGSFGGFAGDTVRLSLYIPSLLYHGDDLSVIKEVRLYLARQIPPVYDPVNEPHEIVSDIVVVSFLLAES